MIDIRKVEPGELCNIIHQLFGDRTGIERVIDHRYILLCVRGDCGETISFRTVDMVKELERAMVMGTLKLKEENRNGGKIQTDE